MRVAMLVVLWVCCFSLGWGAPIVRNLVVDYGADPTGGDVSIILQRAVDEVAANPDGGTVVIPATNAPWLISRPIFVGSPKVEIAGQGMGSIVRQTERTNAFLLGVKAAYPETPISDGHFPNIAGQTPPVLDESVKEARGLRTTDGTVRAAGYFPLCPFTLGARLQRYWNNGTHYAYDPLFTFEICVKNNGAGVMTGTVCGLGDGPRGDISDPMTIWTIESDPATGKNMAFKARVVDAAGKESILTLPFSAEPLGRSVHRLAVQINFTEGIACAWSSSSSTQPRPLTLSAGVKLAPGSHFKQYAYGAFRLGQVSEQPFTGSPASMTDPQRGDWSYCGVYFGDAMRYTADMITGAAQTRLDGAAITDFSRYYIRDADAIAFSNPDPVEAGASRHLVRMRCGPRTDGERFFGYWLPMRPLALNAQGGVTVVRNLRIEMNAPFTGAPIVIGEASKVKISEVVATLMNAHGVTDWGCHVPNCRVEMTNVAFDALDAIYYGKSQEVQIDGFVGRPGWAAFRLVGCKGSMRSMLLGDSDNTDFAYFMLHSGPLGGPLTIRNICFDNEGYENPHQNGALFYAEPSLHPGPAGNVLDISLIYNGTMYTRLTQSVVCLADAPGIPTPAATATLRLSLLSLPNSADQHPDSLVRSSSAHWSGRIDGYPQQGMLFSYGPIRYTGPGQCGLRTYQNDASGLPTTGSWLANCHQLRVPDAITKPGSGTIYLCTKSGTYGTAAPPVWTLVKMEP